jgi:hypothetical protein
MHNDDRWNGRNERHRDRNDENRDGYRNERGWEDQQGYDRDEWNSRGSGYNNNSSRSGYGSSMSSQGGGTGSFYNEQDGYMQQGRHPGYSSDQRRYTDNYYNDRDRGYDRNRGYDDGHRGGHGYNESRMFNERMYQAPKGQSYDSAYGNGGRGDHMGYGEKGAQYRDEFNGNYGGWQETGRVRNRDHYREIGNGMENGMGNEMGSDSYFINTRDDAYREGRDHWNIGNYGERDSNDQGYGYGRNRSNRNRNDQNYTW